MANFVNDISATGSILAEGLGALLKDIEQGLGSIVLANPLPLVGSQIASALENAPGFFGNLASNVATQLRSDIDAAVARGVQIGQQFVQNELVSLLGPGGADVLGHQSADGSISYSPGDLTVTATASQIQIETHLAQRDNLGSGFHFSAGLSSLGLSLDTTGGVALSAGYTADLIFGLNADGFYFVAPAAVPLVQLFVQAAIPGLSAAGQLGPLTIQASDLEDPDNPDSLNSQGLRGSLLYGNFTVTCDQSAGQQFGVADLGGLAQHLHSNLTGSADLLLKLGLGLDDNSQLPSLTSDFVLHWRFGSVPTLDFNQVQLNLGDFLDGLSRGLFHYAQDVIAPIEPVLNFLTSDLPLLSNLGVHLSPVDIARIFGGPKGNEVADFIEAADSIVNTISVVTSIGVTGDYDLGSFRVVGPDLSNSSSGLSASDGEDVQVTEGSASNSAVSSLKNLEQQTSGLSFPLLDNPASLFTMFLGQNPTLVAYTMPDLHLGAGFAEFVPLFWGVLGARFAGGIDADLHLSFGMDTYGLQQALHGGGFGSLANGFYIADSSGLSVSAYISAGGELDVNWYGFEVEANVSRRHHRQSQLHAQRSQRQRQGAAAATPERGTIQHLQDLRRNRRRSVCPRHDRLWDRP